MTIVDARLELLKTCSITIERIETIPFHIVIPVARLGFHVWREKPKLIACGSALCPIEALKDDSPQAACPYAEVTRPR